MTKSLFVTSIGLVAGKAEAAASVFNFAAQKNARVAYFKPVASSNDDAALKAVVEKASLPGSVADYYALTQSEVLSLLAQGQEDAILDAVFQKYSRLAASCDVLVIEGVDLVPTGGALANLDATIAANLKAWVILLTGDCLCGCGQADLGAAALAVATYKSHLADVCALAVLATKPTDLSDAAKQPALEGLEVWNLSGASDLASCLESACEKICQASSGVITPKRFEFELIEKARQNKQHIVLPEGEDERILLAAEEILAKDFANITILGDCDAITAQAKTLGLNNLLAKAQLINPHTSDLLPELTRELYELRKNKGMTEEQAADRVKDRNFFGTMLVKMKKADGLVSGAAGTTADTIRPALSIIKTKPGYSLASSVFLMCLKDRIWVFGDCAINPNPTPQQLAEIAVVSAQTAKAFGVEPKVAMLSYSTGSSGTGADVEAVTEATGLARELAAKLYPGLELDGPLQFDAAVDPRTGASKMPGSPVAGQATVMVFPDLQAGNIAYKAVQRTANAVAIGPVIQGLNAPINDLSRGALVADIINTVAITALQAIAEKG